MREILFKAKRKDNGKWIEGDYNHFIDGRIGIEYTHRHLGSGIYTRVTIEVDPETICQYTGLKDKNGKKVFEGDIVSVGLYYAWVRYNEGNARFVLVRGEYQTEGCNQSTMNQREVIGNIFDNPELMESE